MNKHLLISSLVVLGFFSNLSMAGGKHEQTHEKAEAKTESSDHGAKGHHEKKSAGHGGDHEHDSEASPVGVPADASKATRTIAVTTKDTMRYEFSSDLNLKAGEIVKFVVTNEGKIAHEFSVGDAEEQKSHLAMMANMPNMVHEDGNTVTVKPGQTKTLTWKFTPGSEVVFACNIPGHFQAGMFAKAKVGNKHPH